MSITCLDAKNLKMKISVIFFQHQKLILDTYLKRKLDKNKFKIQKFFERCFTILN